MIVEAIEGVVVEGEVEEDLGGVEGGKVVVEGEAVEQGGPEGDLKEVGEVEAVEEAEAVVEAEVGRGSNSLFFEHH